MITITSFFNFVGSLFNCALNICIFSIIDELKFKPEKGVEFSIAVGISKFPLPN